MRLHVGTSFILLQNYFKMQYMQVPDGRNYKILKIFYEHIPKAHQLVIFLCPFHVNEQIGLQ